MKCKVKKIINQCPYCGHLYAWLVETNSDEDNDCILDFCEYCQQMYFSGPVSKVKCLACSGQRCGKYQIAYKESGIVNMNSDGRSIYADLDEEELWPKKSRSSHQS